LEGQSQGQVGGDVVEISSALALAREVALGDQFPHDALGPALGDLQGRRYIAHPDAVISRDQQEGIAMIGQQTKTADGALRFDFTLLTCGFTFQN
jgi:hypothetical protein